MSTTMTSPAETLKQEIADEGCWDELQFFNIKFYEELVDYGIESLTQFEDSYQGQYRSGADFAENLCDECGYLGSNQGIPDFILNHIDWETVWSNELRFDYFSIEAGGYMYFFSSNF